MFVLPDQFDLRRVEAEGLEVVDGSLRVNGVVLAFPFFAFPFSSLVFAQRSYSPIKTLKGQNT